MMIMNPPSYNYPIKLKNYNQNFVNGSVQQSMNNSYRGCSFRSNLIDDNYNKIVDKKINVLKNADYTKIKNPSKPYLAPVRISSMPDVESDLPDGYTKQTRRNEDGTLSTFIYNKDDINVTRINRDLGGDIECVVGFQKYNDGSYRSVAVMPNGEVKINLFVSGTHRRVIDPMRILKELGFSHLNEDIDGKAL